jgi:hypothetical protein
MLNRGGVCPSLGVTMATRASRFERAGEDKGPVPPPPPPPRCRTPREAEGITAGDARLRAIVPLIC